MLRRRSRQGGVAALLILALVAAACGSSTKTTSAGGSGQNSTGTASNSSGTGVAAARALVAQDSIRPTTIPTTGKIGKPIPKGESIYYIGCVTPACVSMGHFIKQATDLLGWKLTVIDTNSTPTQLQAAWTQVDREKPNGVIFAGDPTFEFSSQLATAVREGVDVTACCITTRPPTDGLKFVSTSTDAVHTIGGLQAAWVTAESNGKADSLYVDLPDLPIFKQTEAGYAAGLTKYCPGCKLNVLNLPLSSIGSDAPSKIASYLRAHPSVKYVALADDPLGVGLPAALRAAGITGVKWIGTAETTVNLEYLASGQQTADTTIDYYGDMWSCVDALARLFAGVPLPSTTAYTREWLLTGKTHLPSTKSLFPVVSNTVQQYKALWGVGS